MNDWLLLGWLILDFIWSVGVIGGCAYIVFWKGHSGWWFILAIALVSSVSLYKALAKKYKIEEEDEP